VNILISSAGRRVSLVEAFKNELRKIFPEGKVFTTDMNPSLSSACQAADRAFTVGRITESATIGQILDICKQHNVKLVIPTIDTEVLIFAEHKALFKENGIDIIVSDSEFIKICRNKWHTNDFFQKFGINIPKAIDKENPTYPFFIKPFDGSLSKDIAIIKEPNDLTPQQLGNPKLMFMEYLSPNEHEEYTVDMYYGKDNRLKCLVPRHRVEIRGGEISKGLTRKNEVLAFLKQHLPHIQGAIGCLTLQLFMNKTSKNIYGIEINPRFGGGFPMSYQAGANYPKYLIQEYLLGEYLEYTENWEENVLMLRYDKEVIVRGYTI
jgi:carbamoyl-phosphate synthase large subunit